MAHVVRAEMLAFSVADGAGEVVPVPLGEDNIGWLLICRQTGEACAVDGPEAGPYLERCDALGVRLTTVWNTHTHGDHIGLNRDLQAHGLLAGLRVFAPAAAKLATPGCTDPVDEGSVAGVGALQAQVLRTDGHLDGHVSFYVPGAVFCGDTMFTAGCGYLFDGPPSAMWASLQRLAALPDATAVCCAHEYTWSNLRFAYAVEPANSALQARIRAARTTLAAGGSCVPSTVALERATNPFLRPTAPTMRAGYRDRFGTALPDDPELAFAALRSAKDGTVWRALTDDTLPR